VEILPCVLGFRRGGRYRYLRWLDKYEWLEGEESPLGLILCAEKTAEHVELLQLETSGIRVAEYLTELPPRHLLETKLHEAIRLAREQIAAREVPKLEGRE
jgi:hypothetical protein